MAQDTDNFFCFFEEYATEGFVVGIIFIVVFSIFGGLACLIESSDLKEEIRLYQTLESSEKLAGEVKDDSDTGRAALKIKSLSQVLSQKEVNQYELMKQLQELSQVGDGPFYHNLFLKKYDKIIALEKGEISNLSNSVKKIRWGPVFSGWFIVSYVMLSVCMAFNFIWKSACSGKMLDWPWRKAWTYFTIAFMAPLLIPCMIGALAGRLCVWLFCKMLSISEFGTRKVESRTKENINPIKKKHLVILERIEDVNKRSISTREKYAVNCIGNLDKQTDSLKMKVILCKQKLSDFGTAISNAQRELAETRKQLENWESGLKKLKEKSKPTFLKDFERLLNLSYVRAVDVCSSLLDVYTDTVFIDYKGKRYEIGMFQISIDMFQNSIRLQNFTSTHPGGYYHPYGDSNLCWGSLTTPIRNALAGKEYTAAVQYIIQALHSAEGDHPERVKEWKEVSKNELPQTA